jgi:hypothetical protein
MIDAFQNESSLKKSLDSDDFGHNGVNGVMMHPGYYACITGRGSDSV